MNRTTKVINRYLSVSKQVKLMIAAALMLQLLNASFNLILNLHLRNYGYSDSMIANFTSYRFISILVFSIPMGLYIKGRHIKPVFIVSSIMIPVMGFLMLMATKWHVVWLIKLTFLLGSVGFMFEHVSSLPFILRHSTDENLSEGIALNFAVWSFATILAGVFISAFYSLSDLIPVTEFEILMLMVFLSFGAFFIFLKVNEKEPTVEKGNRNPFKHIGEYDWWLILEGLLPMMIISIGAGLTIPFMNLFFNSVFNMDSGTYSVLGSISAVFVFIGGMITPVLRRKYGYGKSIAVTQMTAIFFLFVLAATEPLSYLNFAVWIAVGCFILRQPLMNMASPITSELVMKYVGPKNRELISAIQSCVWNAAWFFSAKIFQYLRSIDLPYYKILIITGCLYTAGTLSYLHLVAKYKRKLAREVIVSDAKNVTI